MDASLFSFSLGFALVGIALWAWTLYELTLRVGFQIAFIGCAGLATSIIIGGLLSIGRAVPESRMPIISPLAIMFASMGLSFAFLALKNYRLVHKQRSEREAYAYAMADHAMNELRRTQD